MNKQLKKRLAKRRFGHFIRTCWFSILESLLAGIALGMAITLIIFEILK